MCGAFCPVVVARAPVAQFTAIKRPPIHPVYAARVKAHGPAVLTSPGIRVTLIYSQPPPLSKDISTRVRPDQELIPRSPFLASLSCFSTFPSIRSLSPAPGATDCRWRRKPTGNPEESRLQWQTNSLREFGREGCGGEM